VIKKWEDPHFLTLTFKACSEKLLRNRINAVYRAFGLIYGRYKKDIKEMVG